MMDMVERVARAMKPTTAKLVDRLISMGADQSEAIALLPLPEARAAIEAMREPTEAMLKAGASVEVPRGHGGDDWNEEIGDYEAESAYTAMIDAALTKKSPA